MKAQPIQWERMTIDSRRLRVAGGWIVEVSRQNRNWFAGSGSTTFDTISAVFIPDKKHLWKITENRDGTYTM
jgi:hypothetical protein